MSEMNQFTDAAPAAAAAAAAVDSDSSYGFNAAAFPLLFDSQARDNQTMRMDALTPLGLNQQGSAAPAAAAKGTLDLTIAEAHNGHLIGSIVWEGGSQ